jgi:hypothetical protein
MRDQYVSAAQTAKLVRVALKQAFPATKFSVRTSTYAGGASVRVRMDGRADTSSGSTSVVRRVQRERVRRDDRHGVHGRRLGHAVNGEIVGHVSRAGPRRAWGAYRPGGRSSHTTTQSGCTFPAPCSSNRSAIFRRPLSQRLRSMRWRAYWGRFESHCRRWSRPTYDGSGVCESHARSKIGKRRAIAGRMVANVGVSRVARSGERHSLRAAVDDPVAAVPGGVRMTGLVIAGTGWALAALALVLVHHAAKGRAWSPSTLVTAAMFGAAGAALVVALVADGGR